MDKKNIKIGLNYFLKTGKNLKDYIDTVETVYEYDELIHKYNNFFIPAYYLLSKIIDEALLNSFKFNDNFGNENLPEIAFIVDRRRNLTFKDDIELIQKNLKSQLKIIEKKETEIMPSIYISSSDMKNIDEEFIYSELIDVNSNDYFQVSNEISALVNYRVQGNPAETDSNLERSDIKMKKIFISHSSKDSLLVEDLITLIELIGVDTNKIFCSSIEGYGVQLGENFLERLKKELDDDILVIFILSKNFYASPICLCEMGATWIRTNYHIPVLIPPLTFDDVRGVLHMTQGFSVTDRFKLNSFKAELEKNFSLSPIENTKWERNRDKIITRISQNI